ncbi:MAG: Low iron-inducible periplasmic protein-domain-containing protein [Monoraphidium minutum]|nr:MAG: Low iron-inducible periplasmic protein-domain-containing protein [Monoraphidium minutum]
MRTSSALFAVAALALVAAAAAQGTKGTTLRGFTFSSDVSDFLAISEDICDMRKLLNNKEPPYEQALAIYMDGKNAKSGLSMRRLATGMNYDAPFWKEYQKHFKTPLFLDDIVQRAFSGLAPYTMPVQRVQLIIKSLESGLQVAVLMNQLDLAVKLTKEGKKDAALNAIDAAWAIYVGGATNCGLWTVSMKRANEFGTKVNCEKSQVAGNILTAMLDAQKAARAGDAKGVEAARNKVQSEIAANYIQTEAYAFFRTIAPLVYAANKTAGEALDFWLFPGQPTVDDVDLRTARALSVAYKGMGVTPKMVGEYGKKQPELGCQAYVPAAADAGGLLSATDAKDSLRPTDAPAAGGAAAAAPAAAAKPAGKRRFLFFRL